MSGSRSAIGATGCSGNVAGAAWADANRDGLLDLFLPQYGGPSRRWVARGRPDRLEARRPRDRRRRLRDGRGIRRLRQRRRPGPLTRKRGHWLELRLVGTRSARDACGARVSLEVPGVGPLDRVIDCGSQGLGSSGERIVHFGLGRARRYRELAVAWPSGTRDSYGAGPADRILTLRERRRGRR